jgi:hypothetical protein
MDLNFAFRACLGVSIAVFTPPPTKDKFFYKRGRALQERLDSAPDSYLQDNFTYTTLEKKADLSKLLEYEMGTLGRSITESEVLIYDYGALWADEIQVPFRTYKTISTKKIKGYLRKKEVEEEQKVEEMQQKTIYRVHVHDPWTIRKSGRVYEGFIYCPSANSARFLLKRLQSIAEDPGCSERLDANRFQPGDNPNGTGDSGQKKVFMRWKHLANMKIPIEQDLDILYGTIDADQANLIKLKEDKSTWF